MINRLSKFIYQHKPLGLTARTWGKCKFQQYWRTEYIHEMYCVALSDMH